MNNKLLTIAIPTFNRSVYLNLCLRRLTEEIKTLSQNQRGLIDVYVSNNASTDATLDTLDCYKEFITAVTQKENIGNDNIENCYRNAKTPYVWIMGDDDVVLPGKLQVVLTCLLSGAIDILYLGGYGFVNIYTDEPRRGSGVSGVIWHTSALDFVRHAHVGLTFITAVIVRTDVNLKTNCLAVKDTSLPQLNWIFTLVRDGRKFVTLKDRVYAAKMNNSGGYGAIEVFGVQLMKITSIFFQEQKKICDAIQNGVIVTWFPIWILRVKGGIKDYQSEDIHNELHRLFKGNWRYHVFLRPLVYLPVRFAKMYYLFLRLCRKLFAAYLL